MMKRLTFAFKAFLKAFNSPEKAEQFLIEPKVQSKKDRSHLQLLRSLQQAGRLIDFLSEDIQDFTDAQVGAAVRQIHAGCRKSLEDLVTIRPLMQEQEGDQVTIPSGYSAAEIKLVGNVKGNPPFRGTLVHRGWKAHKQSLPKTIGEETSEIITPAEIEIK